MILFREDNQDIRYVENPKTESKLRKTQEELNQITRLLHNLCTLLENPKELYSHPIQYILKNDALNLWWTNHKEIDKIRVQEEMVTMQKLERERRQKIEIRKKKAQALLKLTKEERELLGLPILTYDLD